MKRKRCTLHCPFCHTEYELFETEEELKNDYLFGKHLNGGMRCSNCGKDIIFTPTNLYPNQSQ